MKEAVASVGKRVRKAWPKWRRRIAGLARVAGVFAVIGLVAAFISIRHAKAETAKQGRRLGRELAQLGDLMQGRHQIKLNGEEIFLANNITPQPVHKVLDRFEKHCKDNTGALGELWAESTKGKSSASSPDWSIVRDEDEGEGIVLCLAKNDHVKAIDALAAFSKSRDLGDLGKLRYAYARPTGEGNTHVMAVWTEGSFKLDSLLNEAEGRVKDDAREAPRPPSSTFLFDARIEETPYGVRIYKSKKSPGEVASFYDEVMDKKGWDVVAPPAPDGEARGYVREGVQIIVGATRDPDSGETLVSIADMGASAGWSEVSGAPISE